MASKGGVIVVVSGEDKTGEVFNAVKKHMDETQAAAKKTSESLGSIGQSLMSGLQAAGIAVGVREIISGFKEMVTTTMEAGVQLEKLHQQTGISAENLSVLKFAAASTGVEFETLTKGFKKLAVTTYDAEHGSKAAVKGFEQLGISAADLKAKGNDMYAVLAMVADKFREMPDGIEKSDTAAKIFGARMGSELIPLLNQGSEALADFKSKAPIFSEDDLKKMEDMHKATEKLDASWQKMSLTISSRVAPWLTWYFDKIASGKSISASVNGSIDAQAKAMGQWMGLISLPGMERGNPYVPGAPAAAYNPPETDTGKKKKDGDGLRELLLADRTELAEQQSIHKMSVADEVQFWQDRIGAFRRGSEEYLTVLNEINRLAAKLPAAAPAYNALVSNLSKLGDKAAAVARQMENLKDAEALAAEQGKAAWDAMIAPDTKALTDLFPPEKLAPQAKDYSKVLGESEKYAHAIFDPLFDLSEKWDQKWKHMRDNLLRAAGQSMESTLFGALFGDPQGRGGKGWDGSSFEGNTQPPGRAGIAGAGGLLGAFLSKIVKPKDSNTSNGGLGSGAGALTNPVAGIMQMGKGAQGGGAGIQVVIQNTGTPQDVQKTSLNGSLDSLEGCVVNIVTKDIGTGGPISRGLGGLFGLL